MKKKSSKVSRKQSQQAHKEDKLVALAALQAAKNAELEFHANVLAQLAEHGDRLAELEVRTGSQGVKGDKGEKGDTGAAGKKGGFSVFSD